MKPLLLVFGSLLLAVANLCAAPARLLEKADVLPLALDDAFQFRKTKVFHNDPDVFKTSLDKMISFERQRVNFGAVNNYDRQERYGYYFTFFWRAQRPADLVVRLEYRQQNLGSHVQAREKIYKGAKGTMKSEFEVIGDDYRQEGKITAWRVVVIEAGRIVALNQSFLWN